LGMARLRVRVFEGRAVVGGACVTQPGELRAIWLRFEK
jgi:hypothetical protein